MPDPVDLPVELLLEIFSTLSVDCLLALAKTSRQFNSICIPLFFTRHGISDPSTVFEFKAIKEGSRRDNGLESRENDVLSGLAVAFDVTSIEEFTCIFSDYGSPRSTEVRVLQYRRLLWTLRRLSRVGKVTFRFNSWDTYETWTITGDLARQRRKVITGLFNVCLQRGCTAFHVDHSTLFPQPPLAHPKSGISRVLHGVKNVLLHGPHNELGHRLAVTPYKPFPKKHHLSSIPLFESARKSSQLQHLTISAAMVLYPPCSYWTYSVLYTPRLTSLTLSAISLPQGLWEAAFLWLIPPLQSKLLEFNILDCSDIPRDPFIEFLIKLQALTCLKIDFPIFSALMSPWPNIKEKTALPKLISLSANLHWITFLCGSIQRPTLTSVEIIPDYRFSFGNPLPEFVPTLSKLASSSRSSQLPASVSALPHPTSEQVKKPEPGIQIILNLDSRRYTHIEFREDLVTFSNPQTRVSSDPSVYIADHITHLVIRIASFEDCATDRICEFFGWWKNLRCVTLKTHDMSSWEKRWMPVWTEERIERLVEDARACCPLVTSIIFDDRVYPVDME